MVNQDILAAIEARTSEEVTLIIGRLVVESARHRSAATILERDLHDCMQELEAAKASVAELQAAIAGAKAESA